ncbi:MAG: 3-deoxy-8-phosphooctulonate synthase [Desulfobacula sp.]|jgi:2-dehydro-3-deoxyphosphooctonate aldolase (KDO 8-P synthase)|uniref:3-deoxy-8-phosphooctulonate synthase n=1 Tax=Desulfobacula sp. TaxID=2593537 RepID=UPI001E00F657|nr:3-deoxy-8-phosphooctulonate synthase [Desulfobacula sp.]MBT3485872.1 3-deoxy-8-phosphooctulonate synthase [Desulfobacula sp.]MBT3805475.1 3-deoxy-8-phosphooctulonate synthase [Desulfobacula sp.]MBT4026810.1 3-deoxy-8-phosphooctulonate synthase [Desulfobacula sp.]MBT4199586.1 3-deoxy-8-phosphooctulonate synthase [Desulfobacula sp.]
MNNFFFNLIDRSKPVFFLIAGPCVIENYETTYLIAEHLKKVTRLLDIPFIFKASFDKANRTSIQSFRGPGFDDGLSILNAIKKDLNIPILSDIHLPDQAEKAAKVLDIIQIPAFLCRQTDLILAACNTGKPVNIKKGQFLSPIECRNILNKAKESNNTNICITERGSSFGYNNLVVDFRSIPIIKNLGVPVVFDATHSVQLPGGAIDSSAGERQFVPTLSKAAIAAGADGLFIETHPDPEKALCDGPNSLQLNEIQNFLSSLMAIKKAVG